jgi:hypothetical protein
MANKIIPPAPLFGPPFTKLIKVFLANSGTISVSSSVLKNGNWTPQGQAAGGILANGNVSFEMGVKAGHRAVFTTSPTDWMDAWRGTAQYLIGQPPGSDPFVFGEADFRGGSAGFFPAPGLIHTLKKVPGMLAVKLVTTGGKYANGAAKLTAMTDHTTEMAITQTIPEMALVLWLEANQNGFLRFAKFPQPNGQRVPLEVGI